MLLTRAPLAGRGGRSLPPAAARLACVKPAASVHPEPGSNSPLLKYITFFFFSLSVRGRYPVQGKIDGTMFLVSLFSAPLHYYEATPAACPVAKCHCSCASGPSRPLFSGSGCFPIADAKLYVSNPLVKTFREKDAEKHILKFQVFDTQLIQ